MSELRENPVLVCLLVAQVAFAVFSISFFFVVRDLDSSFQRQINEMVTRLEAVERTAR